MCRLFAFSFSKNTPKDSRISSVALFKALSVTGQVLPTSSPGHADGWGVALYDSNKTVPLAHKSVLPAHADLTFLDDTFFCDDVEQSGLMHLRKKTIGDTLLINTHPFIEDGYSFIHNGTISHAEAYPRIAKMCTGGTDSERLFKRFLEIKKSENVATEEAFIRMLEETKELYPSYSAINTILHDGGNIYASRVINLDSSSYARSDLLSYYTLYIGKTMSGDIIVSSEKIPHQDISYTLLPNNSVSSVRLSDGEVKTIGVV